MQYLVTGTMVSYYFVCKRKLYYHAHQLRMEQNNEDVALGKLLGRIQLYSVTRSTSRLMTQFRLILFENIACCMKSRKAKQLKNPAFGS